MNQYLINEETLNKILSVLDNYVPHKVTKNMIDELNKNIKKVVVPVEKSETVEETKNESETTEQTDTSN